MASAATTIPVPHYDSAAAAAERLIVALDVPTLPQAHEIVNELGNTVSHYKVGPHLFVKGLIDFIEYLKLEKGKKIFLDFKSFDIGDTIRGMSAQAARLDIDFMTIGRTASTIVAAKEAREERPRPKILVVTLLTDLDQNDMRAEFNTEETVEQFVARRAIEAERAGADGVICSPREVRAVRAAVSRRDFLIVTPGIRPIGISSDDQKRVATPRSAILAGADHLVVGRPIIKEKDKLASAERILAEIGGAIRELNRPAMAMAG